MGPTPILNPFVWTYTCHQRGHPHVQWGLGKPGVLPPPVLVLSWLCQPAPYLPQLPVLRRVPGLPLGAYLFPKPFLSLRVAEVLEGKGAGKKGRYQGKAAKMGRRMEAQALLQKHARLRGLEG